jgi:hypothetical protein
MSNHVQNSPVAIKVTATVAFFQALNLPIGQQFLLQQISNVIFDGRAATPDGRESLFDLPRLQQATFQDSLGELVRCEKIAHDQSDSKEGFNGNVTGQRRKPLKHGIPYVLKHQIN